MYFHVFFDKLSNKLMYLLFVCFFPGEIAFSGILRIKTIFFGRHSILREKKSQLAAGFEQTWSKISRQNNFS